MNDLDKTVLDLYNRGLTTNKISQITNRSPSGIKLILKKNNINTKTLTDYCVNKLKEFNKQYEYPKFLEYKNKLYHFNCNCGSNFTTNRPNDILLFRRRHCGCSRLPKIEVEKQQNKIYSIQEFEYEYKKGKHSKMWKGYEDVSGSYINKIKITAKSRNIEFAITAKDAWDQFIKQNKKCALTGLKIELPRKNIIDNRASLDRIDSKIGYFPNNIQWVHKLVNQLKWDLTTEELLYWCTMIVDYHKDH